MNKLRVASWIVVVAAALTAGSCGTDSGSNPASGSPTPTPSGSGTTTPTPTATNTPVSQTLRFVALGDSGKANTTQYSVAAAATAKCAESGCDFGMLLGDNYYPSGVASATDPLFDTMFEQPYGGTPFPWYIALGNHDYGGDGAGYQFERGAFQVAYGLAHSKYKLPAEYYSFDEEVATFLGLGTNLIFWDHAGDGLAAQTDYFSTILDGSTRPWKIAFGHHPYISNGPHGNAGTYEGIPGIPIVSGASVKTFFDDTLCGRVDLYIGGHDHSRQILNPTASCDMTFVVSGAGASTTELTGSNPTLWQAATAGFTYFVVTDEKITIEMLDGSGNVEYTTEIVH